MDYDLALIGGEVVDPETGTIRAADIGIRDGVITEIADAIDRSRARSILDAKGRFVTPGLVDLHAHVNWRIHGTAIDATVHAPMTGVTTWIDAGSANATNYEALVEYVMQPADIRILAFLRLEHPIPGVVDTRKHASSSPAILADVAKRNSETVVGVKVSMGQCEMTSLHLALEAAELAGLPLMVHIAQTPPDVRQILPLLRKGDIVTHALTGQGMRLLESDGRVLDLALEARERGVLLDVGHGAGSFSWDSAEKLVAAGLSPNTISTDAWQVSVGGPMFDLPTCLSKMLFLGMTFTEVIQAATTVPAKAINREGEFGTLRVNAQADLAVLRIESGEFPLYDTHREVRIADKLVRAETTLVAGRELSQRAQPEMAAWLEYALTHDGHDPNPQGGIRPVVREFQEELVRRHHTPYQMAPIDR